MTEHLTDHATEQSTQHVVDDATAAGAEMVPPVAPISRSRAVLKVVRDQRKTIYVALGLAVASFWILGQLGQWGAAGCLAAGIGLGLVNHLATEFWLLRIITSAKTASRGDMIRATMVRLVVLAVVAVGLAVWLWPDGVAVLMGLAIFRLIALMMTSITLLKELKEQ